MKIYRKGEQALIEHEGVWYGKSIDNWDGWLNRKNLYQTLKEEVSAWETIADVDRSTFDPPMQNQEIWASGVTYQRSKEARMEEAKEAGGDTFYDLVYDAARPELFFKAGRSRTVGHGDTLFIRRDSTWNVPEPELTLLISSEGTIEGYTIGNDMSSRSIEGENPLYLPQAKVYERCAGLGPCILVAEAPISPQTEITLQIDRGGKTVFQDSIRVERIKRSFEELVAYLFRECDFPQGCFLMTGTGIVPPDDFTLAVGDEVSIHIEGIGVLRNRIAQKG